MATNSLVQLLTGFVVQGHKWACFQFCYFAVLIRFYNVENSKRVAVTSNK